MKEVQIGEVYKVYKANHYQFSQKINIDGVTRKVKSGIPCNGNYVDYVCWQEKEWINEWQHIKHEFYYEDLDKSARRNLQYNYKWMIKRGCYLGYRRGPVPGIHNYNKGGWDKYRGNHGYLKGEVKADMAIKDYESEVEIKIKTRDSRKQDVYSALTDWDRKMYWKNHGRGWKRSRKQKQYM